MNALVLDDSPAMRAILRLRLRSAGFDVLEAADVGTALDRLRRAEAIDIALVDWNLPGRAGLDFVAAARSDLRQAGLKILMVTTELGLDRIREALSAGVDDYLMKPFTTEGLLSKLALLGLAGGRA